MGEASKWCSETLWRNIDKFDYNDFSDSLEIDENRIAFAKCYNFPKVYAIYNRSCHEIDEEKIFLPDRIELIHCRSLHSIPLDLTPIDYEKLQYLIQNQ